MQKFKIGPEIKTTEDIRNLVIELVKRSKEFSQAFINELTMSYVQGSPLRPTEKQIQQIVELTLYDLQMENKIYCDRGIFVKGKKAAKSL